jgi:hypothetical protein
VWSAFEEIASGLSQPTQDKLFIGTAREFYRLGSDRIITCE